MPTLAVARVPIGTDVVFLFGSSVPLHGRQCADVGFVVSLPVVDVIGAQDSGLDKGPPRLCSSGGVTAHGLVGKVDATDDLHARGQGLDLQSTPPHNHNKLMHCHASHGR